MERYGGAVCWYDDMWYGTVVRYGGAVVRYGGAVCWFDGMLVRYGGTVRCCHEILPPYLYNMLM